MLGEYDNLYVQSDTLLLTDVFEKFRNICLEIYGFDSADFFTAPGLEWQAAFKKTKVKVDLLADIDNLLAVEKCTRDGICHAIRWYGNANN